MDVKINNRTIEAPLFESAYDSGFSDPEYFSQVFKKEFDVSSSEFRNK
jgi:AraC-like DNA-binding protein